MNFPGVISTAELYTLSEAKKRLHLGRNSFVSLRKAGLKTLVIGRCHFVDGAELVALIRQIGNKQAVGNGEGGE